MASSLSPSPGLVYLCILALSHLLAVHAARLNVWGISASGLHGDPVNNPPDPYVKVWGSSSFGGMIEFHKDNANPSWRAEFYFNSANENDNVKLEIKDKERNFDDHLGTCNTVVRYGTYRITCRLSKGTVYYSYEFI